MIYFDLFKTFFIIGLLSFGGGYAAIPFIEDHVVNINSWLSMNEFVDVITISQMTPGPIGINSATFVGMQLSGILGAISATVGFVTPSVIIVLILAHFYFKYRSLTLMKGILEGLHPAVVALIASATVGIVQNALWVEGSEITFDNMSLLSVGIAAVMLIILRKTKFGPITIIASSGAIALLIYALTGVSV